MPRGRTKKVRIRKYISDGEGKVQHEKQVVKYDPYEYLGLNSELFLFGGTYH